MSKKLIIHECKECPHYNSKSLWHSDDSYIAICEHPFLTEIHEWESKIRNIIEPPPFCPLENYEA